MIEYRQEFLDDVRTDAIPLLEQHWREIALNQDRIVLNPDWDAYERLEGVGALRIFTARSEGELVGYFCVVVERNLHYKDHLFARNDVVFLRADHRKGFTGIRLIRFAEQWLKDEGVSVIMINVKLHKSFSPVLERMGYGAIETVHSKYIGR